VSVIMGEIRKQLSAFIGSERERFANGKFHFQEET